MSNVIEARVPRITFLLTIPNISTLKTIKSPAFSLQGAKWVVRAFKEYGKQEKKEKLVFYLYCTIEQEPKSTRAASASLKLISRDKEKADSPQQFIANVFDGGEFGYQFSSSIYWFELIAEGNKYLENDVINVEIQLNVSNPNDEQGSTMIVEKIDQCCEMGCLTTLQLKVTSTRNLIAVRSSQFALHKLNYYLSVYKNNVDQIGFYLDSIDPSNNIKSQARILIQILSSKIEAKMMEVSVDADFNTFNCPNVASFEELVEPENGYLNNDCLRIKCVIKVGCCSITNENCMFKLECSICMEPICNQNISSTRCGHIFCTACITKSIGITPICPLCKDTAYMGTLRRVYLPTINKM